MAGQRAKGYIYDFNPKPHTVALIERVQEIIERYKPQLPLTARQIFYVMVGQYDYDKTEQAYSRLCEALVKARRAQLIPFSAIRDDGTVSRGGEGWDSVAQWWSSQLSQAERFTMNRTAGQDVTIELWCEAAGMVPQLLRAVNRYDVAVYSTGGFSSVTVTHEVAERVASRDRPTVFLHVGDFDPSGESIFESMTADIGEFVWSMTQENGMFLPERVALTADQVERYGLPTAPPKRSDSRSARWVGETCQAEAMDPATLREVVIDAVTGHMDLRVYDEVVRVEAVKREQLTSDVQDVLDRRREAGDEVDED